MKTLILLLIATLSFAVQAPIQGLERASAPQKRDACQLAKEQARQNDNVVDINVGCTCEKSSPYLWICFVGFEYIPQEK